VNYDVFDSNEVLETKLLAGKTGYDVVVPGAAFMERQIKAGVFRKLDRSLLPNWDNLDKEILERVALHDPGNQYSVNHMWGTTGLGTTKPRSSRSTRRRRSTAGTSCSIRRRPPSSRTAASPSWMRPPKC